VENVLLNINNYSFGGVQVKKALLLALTLILTGAIFATQFSVGMGFVFNRDRQTQDFDIQFFGRFQAGWPVFGGPILGVIADIPAFGVTLKNSNSILSIPRRSTSAFTPK
jgi:hypothetical protein